WKSMKAMLDKELPAREKRRLFPFWFVILAVTSGFLLGFFMQNVTSDEIYNPVEVASEVQTQVQDKADSTFSDSKRISSSPFTENNHQQRTSDKVIQRNRTNSSIAPFYFSDLINSNHPEM